MGKSKTLILIDGHALAFRQYYALERTNMKTTDGTPTWAVYGFFKAIFDLLKNETIKPDAIAVTFDVSHHTFRTEKYEEYKANREAMPDAMRIQMGLIADGLKTFNIPVYSKEGFEADDVIGTISKKACELGHKILILTGDQDAFQLIDKDGCVKVIIPSKGELKEYDWQAVYDKLGVYPDQVIDFKGLRGDTSDNIPGVKGIGEKIAQKLLTRYGTLDKVLEECENIPEKSIRDKICAGVEQAKLSKFLATIIRDVDIDFDFEAANINLPELSEVTAFLKRMQFYSFIKSINQIMQSFNKVFNSDEKIQEPSAIDRSPLQLGFFSEALKSEFNKQDVECEKILVTDTSDLSSMISKLQNHTVISIKTEYEFVNAVTSKIIGISIGYNDNFKAGENGLSVNDSKNAAITAFYIPLQHNLTNQLRSEDVISALKDILENPNIKKITHDYKTEYCVYRVAGVNIKGVVFDTMLSSYIKNPARNHSLDVQSVEHLDYAMCEYSRYESDKKKRIKIQDALISNVLQYAADTIYVIFGLAQFWLGELDDEEKKILDTIELPVAKVLADMEYIGVSVDVGFLDELSLAQESEIKKLEREIYELAGEGFNINSPRQVGEILFDKMQIKSKKKRNKKQYSTSADILEELAPDNEIVRLILKYRQYSKFRSNYTDALPNLISPVDGRIHTTYNQTITATGRLSSSNPNLQNIPIRSEEGSKIRRAFVPRDKNLACILSADYSQIELRLLAHISEDKNLIDAFNSGIDVHTLTASKVFDVPVAKVTKDMRYKAKAVNFGIVYGQSKYGLAKSIGISPEEADMFIEKYFATYPRVRAYMDATVNWAMQHGFVETMYGRKRYLATELTSTNVMIREFAKRAAINQPMQGSAADLIKLAMIEFAKKLSENNLKSKLIMQVHDELVVEAQNDELEIVEKLIKEAMELNQPLRVPLVVDINVGDSWQEL